MSKVMLVEDDNNLREIYEARLQAEGYTIVTAHDGEEALAVAKTEQPDLIISDVMMPKISGFEMLDILRNTDGLKDVKVIMLTALGQSDDQQRADRLGADSYLVKSQVTLEDIVKVAARLLGDEPVVDAAPVAIVEPVAATEPVAVAEPAIIVEPVAVIDTPMPVIDTPVVVEPPTAPIVVEPAAPVAPVTAPEPPAIAFGAPVAASPVTEPAADPVAPTAVEPSADQAFLESLGASSEATPVPSAQPLAEEAATVEAQIASFEKTDTPAPSEVEPVVEEAAPPETTAPQESEQFVTTAPPDLTSSVDPAAPSAPSAGNDDVLADALQSLTGQAPEAITVTATAPTVEAPAAPDAASRGGNRIIEPLDSLDKPDIHTLLALEEAKEIAKAPIVVPPADTTIVVPAAQTVTTPVVAPAPPVINQPIDLNNIAL